MSLRGRLFLAIGAFALLLLGGVLLAYHSVQQQWQQQSLQAYEGFFYNTIVRVVYVQPGEESAGAVRKLLRRENRAQFARFFNDLMIVNGRQDLEDSLDSVLPTNVDLNPLGAAHRDPATFPTDEIRAGIRQAMFAKAKMNPVAGGFCSAITDNDDEVIGGAWFQPVAVRLLLPFTAFFVPILLGAIAIGVIAYWWLGRVFERPLTRISEAAADVGAGRYDVRVPRLVGGHELDGLIDAFNRMAEKVEGHHAELEREVTNATEEAKRKERALVLSGRLASIGTMAAGIAHEINNPIGGMINAVRKLGENPHLTDRDRVYVGLILDGLERVSGIAKRVLDFSPKELEARPFELSDAVEGARALIEHRLRSVGVELQTDGIASLPPLVGDRRSFQQVLLNVFLNSLNALADRPEPREIRISGRPERDHVVIEIADNGPGLAKELLSRVMDPFFSGKETADSTGLGMFISFSIIQNLGGTMEVDSSPGEGFRVTLTMAAGGEV